MVSKVECVAFNKFTVLIVLHLSTIIQQNGNVLGTLLRYIIQMYTSIAHRRAYCIFLQVYRKENVRTSVYENIICFLNQKDANMKQAESTTVVSRARERQRERETHTHTQRTYVCTCVTACACVYVCMCVGDQKREENRM